MAKLSMRDTAYNPKYKPKGAPIAPVVPTAEPTVADTYKNANISYGDTATDSAMASIGSYYQQQAGQDINEKSIYRNQLKQYQKEIDAVKDIYSQQLGVARTEGEGRLGSQRAIGARSGVLGSDFGEAQRQEIVSQNSDITKGIQAEKANAIAVILGKARTGAQDELKAKREAKQAGADSYLAYLGSQNERKQTKAKAIAAQFLTQGVDPSSIDPKRLAEIAKSIGMSEDDIASAYATAKASKDESDKETDLKTRKTEAEISKIETDIATGKLIELSEGSMLYNPETGETFKNPKTYAPSTGGDGGDGGNKLLSVTEAQNLGVPYGTTVGDAIKLGITPDGKTTGAQQTSLGFYNRGKDALATVATVEEKIKGLGLGGQVQLKYAPNLLKSQDQQIYRQAQRQFTEARLRKESGAAIPNDEYEMDAQTYFAQPGDTAETLKRKEEARAIVLDSLAVSSGGAYKEYYGNAYTPTGTGGSVREQAEKAGYDYEAMKADGLSDEEIAASL